MASGPITSWQTDGEKVETVAAFTSLGSKITVDGDLARKLKEACSLKRQCIKKKRHHFAKKCPCK